MKKRLVSLATSVMMMLSVAAIPTGVHATETIDEGDTGSVTVVNEMYEDVLSEEEVEENMPDSNKIETSFYSTKVSYTKDENVVINAIRDAMTNRDEVITLYYAFDDVPTPDLLNSWIRKASAETGNPKQGDYLMFHIGGASLNYACDKEENGLYYYTMEILFRYYTTAAQEAKVGAKVDEVLASLNLEGKSDYEKVKAIYTWVIQNVDYDFANEKNDSYTLKYSAYAALINKTAVCQGFSNTLYRFLHEEGIDCRIITNKQESHSWNIVKLGDKYYNLDATSDTDTDTYGAFLTGLIKTTASRFTTGEFANNHPISDRDYFLTFLYAPEDLTVIRDGSGATITWKAVDTAEGYYIFVKEGTDGTYEEYGTAKGEYYNISGDLDASKEYMFKVVPYYVSDVSTSTHYDPDLIYSEVYTEGFVPEPEGPTEPGTGGEVVDPEDDPTPQVVKNIVTSNITHDSATISWTGNDVNEGYRVYYRGAGDSSYVLAGETKDTVYVVDGLKQGTDYMFAVESYLGDNYTKKVETDPITTKKKLAVPTVNLSVDDNNVIKIDWNAITGADCYNVYVKGGQYSTYKLYEEEYKGISYKFYDAEPSTEYSFKVTPCYYYGSSTILGTSSVAKAIVTKVVWVAPTVTAVTKSTSSIELNWDSVPGATGYKVYYKKSSASSYTSAGSVSGLSYTVTGLEPGTSYNFKVTPYNANSVSEYSGTVTKSTSTVKVPSAPTNVKATLSSWSTVTVSWTAPANASKYAVYYKKSTDTSYTKAGATTATSYKMSLEQGTKYYFKVTPYNTVGGKDHQGTTSDYVSVTTKKNLPAPASISAKLYGYNAVQVTWKAVSGAAGYDVYYMKAGGSYTKYTSTTATTIKAPNLSAKTAYYFRVYPYYNLEGTKVVATNNATVAIHTTIATPTVKAKLYGYDDVYVSWNKISGAKLYYVYYKKSTDAKYKLLTRTTATSVKAANLADGKKYYFKVMPTYDAGGGVHVAAYKEGITNTWTLFKMAAPKVAKSGSYAKVSYTTSTIATGYQISRSTSKTGTSVVKTVTKNTTKYGTVKATKKKTFYYKVRMYKVVDGKKIYGPWSNPVKFVRK